jgi:hypothetical protein
VNNQLELDCYHKAEAEGQPKPFTLIASDALAPNMIKLWALLSQGDIISGLELFSKIVANEAGIYANNPRRPEKTAEANAIANEMIEWRQEKGLPIYWY